MSNNDDETGTVINFPRVGFATPAEPTARPAADPPRLPEPETPPETAAADRWSGPIARAEMAVMASESITPRAVDNPAPIAGVIPETFLANPAGQQHVNPSEGPQECAASLVALSMAAVIGIAVSAMRGVRSGISSLTGEGKDDGKGSGDSGKKRRKIQPAHEFGESATGRKSGKGSGSLFGSGSGSGGSGGSRRKGSGSGSSSGSSGTGAGGKTGKAGGGSAGKAGTGASGGAGPKTGKPRSGAPGGPSSKGATSPGAGRGKSGSGGRAKPGKPSGPGSGAGGGKPGGGTGGPGKPSRPGRTPGGKPGPGGGAGKPSGKGPAGGSSRRGPGKPGAGKAGPGKPGGAGGTASRPPKTGPAKGKPRSGPAKAKGKGGAPTGPGATTRGRWRLRKGKPTGADGVASFAHSLGLCSCKPGTPLKDCAEYKAARAAEGMTAPGKPKGRKDKPPKPPTAPGPTAEAAEEEPAAGSTSSSTRPTGADSKAGGWRGRSKRRSTPPPPPPDDGDTRWWSSTARERWDRAPQGEDGVTVEWLVRERTRRRDRPRPAITTGRPTVYPPRPPRSEPEPKPESPMSSTSAPEPAPAPAPVVPAPRTEAPAVPGGAVATAEPPSSSPAAGGSPGAGVVSASPELAPQHRTEVTISDVLAKLSEVTEAGFSRHEGSLRLAERCRNLRSKLDDFRIELSEVHNVTGRRTHAAVHRLAEQVEVMHAKILELGTLSLAAAELSEVAESAMYDEYRPMQQRTADVGLVTPSARSHNEN